MKIKQAHKGFTLIEIMIALVIGVFLTAGASQIFLSTNQSNRMQENLSRMQENARFAMNYLTEDIRQAGYWGGQCVKGVLNGATNQLDSSAAIYDYRLTGNDIGGFDGGVSGALYLPDRITIKRIPSGNGLLVDGTVDGNTATGDVKVGHSLAVGQIVLISDCNHGDIFQITSLNASSTHFTHAASGTPGNKPPPKLSQDYTEAGNAKVYVLSDSAGNLPITYSIDTVNSALQRGRNSSNTAPDLVDNIENMQIVYGVKSGNTIYYAPYSGTMNMDNVISVRVSLLVRSPDDNLTATPKAYTYNGASTTPTDKRLRKVYTSTITVRNRLP